MDNLQITHRRFTPMFLRILSIFVILALTFPAAKASYAAPAADLDSLIAAAQAEGALTVIALPEQWCNFGEVIAGFKTQYGIQVNSVSPSASSEDELQAIRDGIQNPGPDTPDVIDVGPGFAVQAKSEGLIAPYQVATWDTIPELMKDAEGYWYGDYYGAMSIAANTNVSSPPASWNDLLAGENVGPVALGGDPMVSNLAFFSVYAAALANGGSLDNIEPGLQFFKSLYESGRLLAGIGNGATLASGETPVLPEWSYLALTQRDANPDAQIEVVVPPNPIASFYAQAINAYAPHPNAAKLWMEYLYSDEVQLMWLDGYCHPSRFEDLRSREVIPDDLLARLPDITGAAFPSLEQIAAAQDFVNANWACMVYGDCPVPNPRIVASTLGDWLWTTDFIAGPLSLSLYESESEGQGVNLLWSGTQTADESGFAFVGYDIHGQNFVLGNFLVVSDGVTEKGLVLETVTIEVFDINNELMAGTARPGSEVWAAAGPQEWQERILVVADPVSGAWQADFKTVEFDITEEMRGWSYASVYDEDGDANEGGTPPTPPSTWRDDFEGSLLDGWYWKNGDSDQWNLEEVPGSLRVYASEQGTPDGNLLLRGAANGDFTIKTHVDFMPDTNFQFAGLVIWQDEYNFLQFGRAFCDVDGCVGKGLYFDKIINGDFSDGNFAMPLEDPSDVYLRLERRADAVRSLYSIDGGISWYEAGTHWIPPDFQVHAVGLVASQDLYTPEAQYPADFEFFELAEGWNFLPEGFHDYDQGDVPSWACNAGGWAADPDDRAADVNIDIVVDDQTVASLPAGEFRQDLLDANVCVDGNCSFSTNLWGVISSYEPHNVDAWAQDTTSGEWVLLSNSDKTLTCRTYDIYAYDPLSGEIKQITDLTDTGEYDPSWSPNGKKIVHDVVYGDGSHELYITDVKTQISTALLGAEAGGNDAAWSPNGKWIAFDRRWVGEPNIYVVPDTGGIPQLAREDAVLADWAPNSKRLVFQQLSDGSIRTVAVDGGQGGETLIAANGSEPVWSPDGNWIAYESNGNIWKVQVNILGRVLGAPIQVTNLSGWGAGGPTWSLDSQTIIFNGGVGGDFDIWKVSAAGGMPTWLTGAPVFGEYGPANAKNSSSIAFAGFSPEVQAARSWVSAYTYDAGTWSPGGHNYHFEATWNGGSETTDEIFFDVSEEAQLYARYALLRPGAVRAGADCAPIDTISPEQSTRFLSGYLTDNPMTHSDAQAYFESLSASAVWDDGQSAELGRHEIIPYNEGDWFNYVCAFTEAPPKMDLRVNYGHDWVESFYEAGHAVSLQVTDSEGNLKATAEVVTEPKDYWGGATGFQSADSAWFDADGNQLDYPPDIQPYDWVHAQVDNGATARVQIGEINGTIDLATDSIQGTINAPWITDPVHVECLDWGSGQEPPFDNQDAGFRLTNDEDPYSCSWFGEWDIQPYQNVGVGYTGPDGHWVANAFFARNPRIVVQITDNWFRAEDFTPNGQLTFWIYEAEGGELLRHPETTWQLDGSGYVTVGMWELEEFIDLVPGQYLVVSDGTFTRELVLEAFTFDVFDTTNGYLAGTAPEPFERPVWVGIGFQDNAWTMDVATDPAGNWAADFGAPVPINYQWVAAQVFDADGDASELRPANIKGWHQVNASGFGDPSNNSVTALEVFNAQLYAGTGNWNAGGQIWRFEGNNAWSPVSDVGFGGGAANAAVIDLGVFQDRLYAGLGWNGAPGQIWRSSDGTTWEPLILDGFGSAENIGVTNFVVFDSMLYAGTSNTSGGAQIWRSSTGDGNSWEQVAPDESGFAGNVTGFGVYGGVLYAAVEPPGGGGAPMQVWRSTNGSDWVTVTADGFGNVLNESTGGFAEFGGYLYLGTQNQDTGAQLWRTSDGMDWQPVIENGFGDPNNIKIESLLAYDGLLYAATKNLAMGMQVWRSADGTTWEQVIENGFDSRDNFSTLWNSATTEYLGQIVIGTWSQGPGGEVWMYTP